MQIWADAGSALTFCNLQTTSSKVIYGQETERTYRMQVTQWQIVHLSELNY